MRQLIILAIALCCFAALATLTNGQRGEGPGAGKPPRPTGDRPPPTGKPDKDKKPPKDKDGLLTGPCDKKHLDKEIKKKPALKTLIDGIKAGNATFAQILSMGKALLPKRCFDHLIRKMGQGGNKCDTKKAEAEQAICASKADSAFLKSLIRCVKKKDDRCAVLQTSTACVGREDAAEKIAEISIQMSEDDCNLPANISIALPTRRLEEYLKKQLKTKEDVKKFVDSIGEEELKGMDCDHRRVIFKGLEKKGKELMEVAILNNHWHQWLHLMPHMPPKLCNRLPGLLPQGVPAVEGLLAIVDKLKDRPAVGCGDEKESYNKPMGGHSAGRGPPTRGKKDKKCPPPTCLRNILGRIKKAGRLNVADAASIAQQLGNLTKCLSPQDMFAAAKQGNCKQLPRSIMSCVCACPMFKKCKPKNYHRGDTTAEEIENMGPIYFTCGGSEDFAALNKTVMCDPTVTQVLEAAGASDAAMVIARTCGGDTEVTPDDFRQKGPKYSLGRGKAAWKKTDKATVKALLPDIKQSVRSSSKKEKKKNLATLREIINKALDQAMADGNFGDLSDSKDFMALISMKSFNNMLAGKNITIVLKLGEEGTDVSGLTPAQRQVAIAKLFEGEKTPSVELIRQMGELVRGFLPSDLDGKLEFLDPFLMFRLMAKIGGWSPKQARKLWKMAKEGLKELNATSPVAALSDADVESMDASALVSVDEDDLEEATEQTLCAICKRLGNSLAHTKCKGKKFRKGIMKICLRKCLKKENPEAKIDQSDIDTLGGLVGLDGGELLAKADPAAILGACSTLRAVCLSKAALDVIQSKLKTILANGNVSISAISNCGWLMPKDACTSSTCQIAVANNPDPDLSSEDNDAEAVDDEDGEDNRRLICFRAGTAEDRAATEAQEGAYGSTVIAGVQANAAAAGASKVRRRRATTPLTCADIKATKGLSEFLTDVQLKAMSNDEVLNCITELGSLNTDSKRQIVADKVKAALNNNVCSLTEDQIAGLGYTAYKLLTPEVIKCLKLDTERAVYGLSYLSQWSQAQLSALVKRYRDQRSNLAPSAMTGDHLKQLSHLVCGMTKAEIKQIPKDQFGEASSTLGEMRKASADCLQGLAHLAKQYKGAVSTWSAATYTELGIIFGGLDGTDLSQASQAESWPNRGISQLTAAQLEKIPTAKLQEFGEDQAQSVSDTTRGQLSVEKQNALLTARDGSDAVLVKEPANMASMKQVSLIGMVVTVLMTFIM